VTYPNVPAPDPLVWFKNQFINAAVIQANITDLFNAIRPLVAASAWTTITLASGFTAISGDTPQYCTIGGILYFRGKIQGTFTPSADNTVVATGTLSGLLATGKERQLTGSSAASSCRGQFLSNGSIHFVTSATVAAYHDIGAFSGILVGS
jgi:hypothetical protein